MKMQNNIIENKSRILALDLIRIFAILSVILEHCVEKMQLDYTVLGRLGVPCFFMLTGALLFSKDNSDVIKFHKSKTLYIYILSVFWIYVYGLINGLSFDVNIQRAITIQGTECHLWYLSTIVFFYFLIPYISNLKFLSTSNILLLIFGCFIYRWLNIFFNFGASASDYIVYIAFSLFGFVAYERKLYEKASLRYLIPIALLILFLAQHTFNQQWFIGVFKNYDRNWYYSPYIILLSCLIFVILLKIFMKEIPFADRIRCVITEFSKCAFGMYIIHFIILCTLLSYTKNFIVVLLLTTIFSMLVVSILGKNNVFRFLFHKK